MTELSVSLSMTFLNMVTQPVKLTVLRLALPKPLPAHNLISKRLWFKQKSSVHNVFKCHCNYNQRAKTTSKVS